MLIITGVGRSGTSVLALWLKRCGIHVNGVWIPSHEAGLEDVQAAGVNDLLDEGLSDEAALAAIAPVRAKVIKDPRFTRDPFRKFMLWNHCHPYIKVLLTHRNPADAVASRARRELYYWSSPLEAQLAFAETICALEEYEIPWRMLMFPHFLDRFEQVYEATAELLEGLAPSRAKAREAWNDTVDMTCVHEFESVIEPPLELPDTGSRWRARDFTYAR